MNFENLEEDETLDEELILVESELKTPIGKIGSNIETPKIARYRKFMNE